jgi:predicted DNA-binding protein (MmcQ/YjbR family)
LSREEFYDDFNDFCRSLPATTYVVQWGGSHVWKVGEKVFVIGGREKLDKPAFTFKASDLNFDVLRDELGFRSAPYMVSRGMKWIQQYDSPKIPEEQLKYYLKESHRMVSLGLSKKLQKQLGLNQA